LSLGHAPGWVHGLYIKISHPHFGHHAKFGRSRPSLWPFVECKDAVDWVKLYITLKVEGIRQRGHPKKTWWDCCVKDDMESLGLSQKDVEFRSKWKMRVKRATG